jgi:hypothetical protein
MAFNYQEAAAFFDSYKIKMPHLMYFMLYWIYLDKEEELSLTPNRIDEGELTSAIHYANLHRKILVSNYGYPDNSEIFLEIEKRAKE